jgi:hypothetical protein
MNKSIIILGVLAVMFTNTSHANAVAKEQQGQEVEFAKAESNLEMNLVSLSESKTGVLSKPEVILESQSKIEEAVSVISTNYKKSLEEVIADDKKITESKEEVYQPLYYGRTVEEVIKQDNQIIESDLSDEYYPLDFDLINKISNEVKVQEFRNDNFKKDSLKS